MGAIKEKLQTSDQLPLVLFHVRGSISMERALKQILGLLEQMSPENSSDEDRISASIDDVETMLSALNR